MKNRIFIPLILLIGILSVFYLLSSNGSRLVYEKNEKVFSSTLEGKNVIDLTSSFGVNPLISESRRYKRASTHEILVIKSGKKFFFTKKDNKVYIANTDGKDLKEIPSSIFSKTSTQDFPFFIGSNNDGSKLLFYRVNHNKAENDPNCSYRFTCIDVYLYDFKTNQLKVLDPFMIYKKYKTDIFSDFVNFTEDEPIFIGYDRDNPQLDEKSKGYIYKMDLETGDLKRISNVAFFHIWKPEGAFINPKNKILLYRNIKEKKNGVLELLAFNYETGQKIDTYLIPKSVDVLNISPDFSYFVYGTNENPPVHSYYEYNLNTKEERFLFKSSATSLVFINDNIIYGDIKGEAEGWYNLYKYNRTLNQTRILEKVDFLYNWD